MLGGGMTKYITGLSGLTGAIVKCQHYRPLIITTARVHEISGQRRDTLIERLTERRDRRPAGNERRRGSHIPASADQHAAE